MRLKFESLHGYFMKIFKYLNDNTKVAYIYVMYTYVQQKQSNQYHCIRYGLDKKTSLIYFLPLKAAILMHIGIRIGVQIIYRQHNLIRTM